MNFNHDAGSIDTILVLDTTIAPPLGGNTNSLQVLGTGSLYLPTGTNAERPADAVGMIRYNTDVGGVEYNTGAGWSTLSSGGGTVSSVTVTGSTGLTVDGSPITTSGTITLTLDAGLSSLASLATTGIVVQSAADTFIARTIAGTGSNISVTNGDGVAGNPTIDLVDAGTPVTASFVKITTDVKGRVTATTPVVAGDITTLVDATYVNVSGDSMNSAANLIFSGGGEVLGLPTVPSGATAATSKAYVDSLLQGLDPKGSVRAATTAAGTLATSFKNGDTIDGVTLATNDRILIKNQAAPEENGIYVVNATGAPTRATDMDAWAEVPGAFVFVEVGTANADTGWVCTSDQGGTLNTTAVTFVQFAGAGAYTAGTGLTLTGTQFSLAVPVVATNGGTGQTTYAVGDLLYASTTTNLSRLADVATGNALISGGVGVAPSWGKIDLTTHVSGVLPIVNGGTNLSTTPTNGQLLIGNGTNYTLAAITQGTGITVTDGAGSITIANAGVTSIAGTANQITASAATGAVTLSLPSAVTFPGSITTTTTATIGTTLTVSGLTANSFLYSGTAGLLTTTAAPTNGQILIGSTGAAPVAAAITQGTGITVTNGAGSISIANAGVTSFTQTVPAFLSQAGATAATGAVNSAITLATQANNTFFAGPTGGGPLAPTFRAIAFADLETAIQLYRESPSTPTTPVATGDNAVAIGTNSNATGTDSFAVGNGSLASLYGAKAYANGSFTADGDAQKMQMVLRGTTTNSTITEIFLDGVSQRMVLTNNSLWTFSIYIAGRRTDATGGGAGYRVDGVIRRDASAATTTLTGTVSKSVLGETNAAWDVTVDADNTNGSLRVRVTGENAKTIRWVASAEIVQVIN